MIAKARESNEGLAWTMECINIRKDVSEIRVKTNKQTNNQTKKSMCLVTQKFTTPEISPSAVT